MRNETYKLVFKDGTSVCIWCKKEKIDETITLAQYRKLDRIEQVNRKNDKVNHKPFMI